MSNTARNLTALAAALEDAAERADARAARRVTAARGRRAAR